MQLFLGVLHLSNEMVDLVVIKHVCTTPGGFNATGGKGATLVSIFGSRGD